MKHTSVRVRIWGLQYANVLMIQSNGWRIPYCADLHVCYSITVMSFKLNIAWKARWKTPDEHCPKLFSVTHFMIIWLLEDWFRYIRDIKQFTFL